MVVTNGGGPYKRFVGVACGSGFFVHGCTYVAEHMDVRERPATNESPTALCSIVRAELWLRLVGVALATNKSATVPRSFVGSDLWEGLVGVALATNESPTVPRRFVRAIFILP